MTTVTGIDIAKRQWIIRVLGQQIRGQIGKGLHYCRSVSAEFTNLLEHIDPDRSGVEREPPSRRSAENTATSQVGDDLQMSGSLLIPNHLPQSLPMAFAITPMSFLIGLVFEQWIANTVGEMSWAGLP